MNPAQASIAHRTERQLRKSARTSTHRVLARWSAFFVLVALAGVFVYSSSRASSSVRRLSRVDRDIAGDQRATSWKGSANNVLRGNFSLLTPLQAPAITIEEGTCSSAQSTFDLDTSVCITVTGSQYIGQRLVVADPLNLIRDEITISSSPQVRTYPLPDTATTPISSGFVNENNLGTWHAYILTGRGGKLSEASFVVKNPTAPTANVEISIARTGGDAITANSPVIYDINLRNFGPDAAANVQFTHPSPSFTTFQSLTVPASPSGITCTDPGAGEAGNVVCTIPSLPANTSITFTVQHLVGDVGPGSSVEASVTMTSDTTNISEATEASTDGKTMTEGTPGACTLTCPSNITVTEDTTGPDPNDPSQTVPGAYVTFANATPNGTCGTTTSSPASGSFFPRGTTPVTSSSSQGDGECSFTVTVTESGDAVSISCPANKVANAGSDCTAIVTLGTPTTTGDNVTVTASRSDGKPMYDCDVNGLNCVRKTTDLPFPAGRTDVTWTATNSSGSQSCTQIVRVYDVTAPTITVTNQTGSADATCQAAVPDFSTIATVSDNCACASSDTSQICDSRHEIVVTQDVAAGTMVGLGTHTIHLAANDGAITPGPDAIIGTEDDIQGNVATATITFTVVDTTAPTFTFVPANVTAYTGPGATTCDTVVDPGTATASDNCGPVTVTRSPSGNTFPVGTTTITWTAKDGANNTTTATQTVTVVDNTVPVITLNGNTPSMWPPNHKYKSFAVTDFVSSVFDNCGGVSVSDVVIDNVTSDETENGNGDGNTTNDILIAANCKSVQLRSERDGGGDGRAYTITFRLKDTHGNVTTTTATVVVRHNPGETVVNSGVHYTVNGTCP